MADAKPQPPWGASRNELPVASVRTSYKPDGPHATEPQTTGPHEGYNAWAKGHFSHIINATRPVDGEWSSWLVDHNGVRVSDIATHKTYADGRDCSFRVEFRNTPVAAGFDLAGLLAKAEEVQAVKLNRTAALQRQILRDGFLPTSSEFTYPAGDGSGVVAQRAENPLTGEVVVYYCPVGLWSQIKRAKRT